MTSLQRITLFFLLFILGLHAQKPDYYFPEQNAIWQVKDASDFGINEQALKNAVDFALANEYSEPRDLRLAILKGFEREPFHEISGPTKKRGGPAGMILKNGYVIASWGDVKRVDMTFSVTKSFLSTIAGLAIDKRLILNEEDKVIDYVWDNTFVGEHNSKISWQHLLQQNSDWSGELWGAKDWADRPPRDGDIDDWKNRVYAQPGTKMEYNDVRVNVLAYALLQVWRMPLPQVLKSQIMDHIGASTRWRWYGYDNSFALVDGIMMQSVSGGGHSGGGLFISTEDMARFGLLFLNDGRWREHQLISKSWIERATQSSEPEPSYGYMWWLNKGNRNWKGLPENIYYAAGFGGNFIVIDQSKDLVVVTRWLEPNKIERFMQTLYEALP